ncbi:LOW QUALITY PROTEIN: hypothetical protein QYF61_020679 [Mycteria americana]|uniref:EF-hand domain-containing protein n=1 Tax=Mycteria americana TaxID=33587 RepID=A0AAN7RYL0_MYCAM|nr:LOW QUALITY PROTEIN: hypothetical protein QYF61_020679 [Mycteria americana]
MGGSASLLPREALGEYQELTFLSKQEILLAYKRFSELLPKEERENACSARVPKSRILTLPELRANPFQHRICRVFSTSDDGDDSMSFEDFLDMLSVFSDSATSDIKSHYAFRIFGWGRMPCPGVPAPQGGAGVNRVQEGWQCPQSTHGDGGFRNSPWELLVWRDDVHREVLRGACHVLRLPGLPSAGARDSGVAAAMPERNFPLPKDFDDDGTLDRKDLEKLVNCLTGQGEESRLSNAEMEQLIQNILEESDIDKDGTINLSEFQHVVSRSPDFARYGGLQWHSLSRGACLGRSPTPTAALASGQSSRWQEGKATLYEVSLNSRGNCIPC